MGQVPAAVSNTIPAAAIDVGTCFLQSMRDDGKGGTPCVEVRNCYRELPLDDDFEEQLKVQGVHYIKNQEGKKLYVLGKDAFTQAGMAEFGRSLKSGPAEDEILKRPMKDGILNPDNSKVSVSILRELIRACIEKEVGPARQGEILYYSIPANPVDSDINNDFHSASLRKFLGDTLSYDARPLNEGLAVVFGENPKMHTPDGPIPFTGIACSFGAGMCNFCLAERGLPLYEFSVVRAGDYIDSNASRMTGQPVSRVTRVKEKKLDFNKTDAENAGPDEEILAALETYYESLISYVFGIFSKKFGSHRGGIEYPIDIVLAGGTANPPGFSKMVERTIGKMDLPFKINEIRLAKDMLRSVVRGCYARAKQAAKKTKQ
jgi:hypothetical protein